MIVIAIVPIQVKVQPYKFRAAASAPAPAAARPSSMWDAITSTPFLLLAAAAGIALYVRFIRRACSLSPFWFVICLITKALRPSAPTRSSSSKSPCSHPSSSCSSACAPPYRPPLDAPPDVKRARESMRRLIRLAAPLMSYKPSGTQHLHLQRAAACISDIIVRWCVDASSRHKHETEIQPYPTSSRLFLSPRDAANAARCPTCMPPRNHATAIHLRSWGRYIPHDDALSPHLPVILFFHGGGWVQGDVDTHDAPCAALGQRRCAASSHLSSFTPPPPLYAACGTGLRVCSVDYRRAPEHVFPAALMDCLVVAQEIARDSSSNAGVILAGDSAGGNLAAVAALKMRASSSSISKCVRGQLLIYPVTDATCSLPPSNSWDLLQVANPTVNPPPLPPPPPSPYRPQCSPPP